MRKPARSTKKIAACLPVPVEPSADGKVVPLRLHVLPRHRSYLDLWIRAGSRMGLCDAAIGRRRDAEVFVWVRENPDPAYIIRAEGLDWVVFDHLRGGRLGAFRSFEAALFCIRPVTPRNPLAA